MKSYSESGSNKDIFIMLLAHGEQSHFPGMFDLTGKFHPDLNADPDQIHFSTAEIYKNIYGFEHMGRTQFGSAQFEDPLNRAATVAFLGTCWTKKNGIITCHPGIINDADTLEGFNAVTVGGSDFGHRIIATGSKTRFIHQST